MVFRSPYPDVEVPDLPLADFVLGQAATRGSRPALVDGSTGRTLTYSDLAGAVRAVAASLARRGFGKGDVMAIYSPNLPESAIASHAAALRGGAATTARPW